MDGHGTVLAFATSGFAAKLIGVDGPDMKRDSIDETYMDTVDAKAFDPADLYDGGELSLTVQHQTSALPPIGGANETVTIDWAGTGDVWSFTAHMTGYSPTAAIGSRMEAKVTLKISGVVSVS